jgi:hypothetical protein
MQVDTTLIKDEQYTYFSLQKYKVDQEKDW